MSEKHTTTNAHVTTQAREMSKKFSFPEKCFFIRPLGKKDEAIIANLYSCKNGAGDGAVPKYGVFDLQNELIGAYDNYQEPFADAEKVECELRWMH